MVSDATDPSTPEVRRSPADVLRLVVALACLVSIPWALGCFSSNSAQQARLGRAAPALAPALMALNSSAIYLGQAAGASSGGWTIEHGGYAPLHWIGAAWMAAAITLSVWVGRRAAVRAA